MSNGNEAVSPPKIIDFFYRHKESNGDHRHNNDFDDNCRAGMTKECRGL